MTERKYKPERTLIIVKPEAIQRHLIGEIITKFEKRGLKLVAAKLVAPDVEQVRRHYPGDEAWLISSGTKTLENYKAKGIDPGKTARELALMTQEKLLRHLSDRPVLATVWEGPHAVILGRKTAGATNPLVADIGSIRGDYGTDSYEAADELERALHTLIHASGSVDEAKAEIKVWFTPEEILAYDLIDEDVFYSQDWGKVKR
jgi:nucleoside-diphosphate kinase